MGLSDCCSKEKEKVILQSLTWICFSWKYKNNSSLLVLQNKQLLNSAKNILQNFNLPGSLSPNWTQMYVQEYIFGDTEIQYTYINKTKW